MKKRAGGNWLVVYVCRGQRIADDVERLLTSEGFLVRSRMLERSAGENGTYEICVLESEAQEARTFLIEKGL